MFKIFTKMRRMSATTNPLQKLQDIRHQIVPISKVRTYSRINHFNLKIIAVPNDSRVAILNKAKSLYEELQELLFGAKEEGPGSSPTPPTLSQSNSDDVARLKDEIAKLKLEKEKLRSELIEQV
jgi:hypothetical protein